MARATSAPTKELACQTRLLHLHQGLPQPAALSWEDSPSIHLCHSRADGDGQGFSRMAAAPCTMCAQHSEIQAPILPFCLLNVQVLEQFIANVWISCRLEKLTARGTPWQCYFSLWRDLCLLQHPKNGIAEIRVILMATFCLCLAVIKEAHLVFKCLSFPT